MGVWGLIPLLAWSCLSLTLTKIEAHAATLTSPLGALLRHPRRRPNREEWRIGVCKTKLRAWLRLKQANSRKVLRPAETGSLLPYDSTASNWHGEAAPGSCGGLRRWLPLLAFSKCPGLAVYCFGNRVGVRSDRLGTTSSCQYLGQGSALIAKSAKLLWGFRGFSGFHLGNRDFRC